MFKTKFTELLNIEYPIMQGGMMWISRAELTSAVCNAEAIQMIEKPGSPQPSLNLKGLREAMGPRA